MQPKRTKFDYCVTKHKPILADLKSDCDIDSSIISARINTNNDIKSVQRTKRPADKWKNINSKNAKENNSGSRSSKERKDQLTVEKRQKERKSVQSEAISKSNKNAL